MDDDDDDDDDSDDSGDDDDDGSCSVWRSDTSICDYDWLLELHIATGSKRI